ncbi:sensor histidine kinase [Streptomyces chromofuscus]|uniref:sensor histidine kinase n=1 Tax=Streptomyces chromofuscus TaxID=42881 RepID=UPI001D149435|nr:HAMP domain-containing sensor histidine kinase [Streptomyces chromofuscus]
MVRLLLTSTVITALSVSATAWLAVETTTRAVQEERGQLLSDDTEILRQLSGFAATHADWDGVRATVEALSRSTGRRIAVTSATGRAIADSAPGGVALPDRASATIDPLHTDTYTEPGAQLAGVDPRAVGPYGLDRGERRRVRKLAEVRLACMRRYGGDGTLRQVPGGRTVIIADGGDANVPEECADGRLNAPTPTEAAALAELNELLAKCLTAERRPTRLKPGVGIEVITGGTGLFRHGADSAVSQQRLQDCVDSARRTQLDPYVAPRALLHLGSRDQRISVFDLSTGNKAKIVGVTGAVLALSLALTAAVAIRLVRPLRALTAAALQPPQRHTRVPVTTKDETGSLAAAFNELTARREQLEAQRRAMVSDIAHELRTPLTNIRGWLEATRDGLLDPDPGLIGSLHDEALLLQHVIDDLQDLAAVDAGTLRLHREPVRADDLIAQVVAAHRGTADASDVHLVPRAEPHLWLDADPVRMRQVLGNLVCNALRHTPAHGRVTLTARPDGDQVVLTVRDTGDGIAPDDLPHVFERFWRAEKSRSRRTGGSGLGLSIVRQFVEAHGGSVTAGSTPGAGAVFTLRLPGASQRNSSA